MSNDPTEAYRRKLVSELNPPVEETPEIVRKQLEEQYGVDNVWDTNEFTARFNAEGFMAPFCVCTRRSDGAKGAVTFRHSPRFYFDFVAVE